MGCHILDRFLFATLFGRVNRCLFKPGWNIFHVDRAISLAGEQAHLCDFGEKVLAAEPPLASLADVLRGLSLVPPTCSWGRPKNICVGG